jgi:hypothetical protein
MNSNTTEPQEKDFNGTQMNTDKHRLGKDKGKNLMGHG